MDASRSLFQQLSGRFNRIMLLSVTLVCVVTTLLVVRDNQVTLVGGEELPLLIEQNKRQQQILATYFTLENLTQRVDAKDLMLDYKGAQQEINDIAQLVSNKRTLLDLMFVGHREFFGVIDTLSKNHYRNNQLKQNTIIQLQLINDQLTVDIKEKVKQRAILLKQINSDKFTDKVTATRAKAYTKLLTQLSHLQQLQQTLIRALLAFQQLNLQFSIIDFDDVGAELKQILALSLSKVALENADSSVIIKQLTTLEQLLFSQQNTVAKWRSQLRLSRSYVEYIVQQQQKLQQLVADHSLAKSTVITNKVMLSDYIPVTIEQWLSKQKIIITHQHLQFAIISIIALLFLWLLTMISNIKKTIKKYGDESVESFTQFVKYITVNDEEKLSAVQFNSAENKKIAELTQDALITITQPEHSEKEYQQQLSAQQISTEKLNQQIDDIQKLQQTITQLELTNIDQNQQQYIHDNATNEKLSNMVVRTMLQSQSVSIGSGVTSLQVYRQLTRIFDWCRQSKMRDKFLSAKQTIILSDVGLHQEIDAALLNIITEAHFQRNQIFYQQDEQLLTQAKLDARLFHRLLNGVCRLLLTDFFKASLQINTTVTDKNEGQQIVRFDFSVTTAKAVGKLPDLVERLLSVEPFKTTSEITAKNETVAYLYLLLNALNVTDKNAELKENGYQFSFTLPIAFADNIHHVVPNNIDLKKANVLLISNDDNTRIATQKAILSADGLYEALAKPELVTRQLSSKNLTEKRVDIIILGSDFYVTSLDNITQHIASLAKSIQPKLFVMQPYFNAPLHRHGLFEYAANPLQKSTLQQALQQLLITDKPNNSLLEATIFSEHQYLPTQVEVLLAVNNPAEYQPLLRVLQWLGLQVQVVCQSHAMLKFWESGRYLLLFTEFEQSPCIEMSAGKSVRRGVFTLKSNHFLAEQKSALAEKWLFSKVPVFNAISNLVTLLQPWLKAKQISQNPIEKLTEQNNENVGSEQSIVEAVKVQEIAKEKSDRVLSALDLTPVDKTDQYQAFSLEKYAENQGSAELAIVMLDDYLADIDLAMRELSQAIHEQNYAQGINLSQRLIKVGTILAAQGFTQTCQQLKLGLQKQKTEDENIHILTIFSELSQQQRLLNQFAEAI